MISFVNGFLCTCSCDVSKAKQGVDPHPKTDGSQNSSKPHTPKNGMVDSENPAVVLGGSLASSNTTANAVAPAASTDRQTQTQAQTQAQAVNILV